MVIQKEYMLTTRLSDFGREEYSDYMEKMDIEGWTFLSAKHDIVDDMPVSKIKHYKCEVKFDELSNAKI